MRVIYRKTRRLCVHDKRCNEIAKQIDKKKKSSMTRGFLTLLDILLISEIYGK
jgi:hypothetical protein